ncbi:hypothetical protein Aph02nite_41980 [Actinoplanes philippinensis]|nr:hypothetical protein Aph02nite_41980 [Actinoplanes philippinensis]
MPSPDGWHSDAWVRPHGEVATRKPDDGGPDGGDSGDVGWGHGDSGDGDRGDGEPGCLARGSRDARCLRMVRP